MKYSLLLGGLHVEHKTPKHIVAVAGYLTNEKDEVLLAKVHWRADTWELPGGQVEEGKHSIKLFVGK